MRLSEIEVWVHASSLHKLMTGNFGLSQTQRRDLQELYDRRDGKAIDKRGKPLLLTPKMKEKIEFLENIRDNPSIGDTGRSYIREFISSSRFEHRDEVTTKETEHGDAWEHHSIEMVSTLIGKKLHKYEGETFRDPELILAGTPDVISENFIIDVKNPWNNKTFDNKIVLRDGELVIPTEYYWQGQAYMELCDKEVFYLIYTLNEHKYMLDESHYSRFSLIDRMFVQKIERDRDAMDLYRERVPAIKKEINFQKEVLKLATMKSVEYLEELKGL